MDKIAAVVPNHRAPVPSYFIFTEYGKIIEFCPATVYDGLPIFQLQTYEVPRELLR